MGVPARYVPVELSPAEMVLAGMIVEGMGWSKGGGTEQRSSFQRFNRAGKVNWRKSLYTAKCRFCLTCYASFRFN